MKVCVILATSEEYRWLADFTISMIDCYWAAHPLIYCCGAEKEGEPNWIGAQNHNPADWIGILHNATKEVMAKGYDQCYLILEDHPPIAKCNAKHLNETLPRYMELLGAAYIGLNGWGQGRQKNGKLLGRRYHSIENVSPEFKWKFSLHPGLWKLEELIVITNILMNEYGPNERTAWIFERQGGKADKTLPNELSRKAYRVCGYCMSANVAKKIGRVVEWYSASIVRRLATRILTQRAGIRVEKAITVIRRYYEGPYPLFWSGLMTKGTVNRDMLWYLKLHGKRRLLREFQQSYAANYEKANRVRL